MRIRFWGTRGSIAAPGPATLRYGGNTACVEVRLDDGTLIVLDCGTGARALGLSLLASGERPIRGHLLITHTHWDHIQGFPFFAPLFMPGNEWDIYAPGVTGRRLEDTLAGQMEYTYFPVRLDQLGANIRYHDVVEGSFQLGSARITAQYLNHPALTLGYRIDCGGASVVYATDHEPHSHHRLDLPTSNGKVLVSQPLHHEDRRHVRFLADADLIIHDAQYTASEDSSHVGWGHTAAEQVVDFALAAGAERLALFHHDPMHDDAKIDQVVATCIDRALREGGAEAISLEITAAAEGHFIELSEDPAYVSRRQETEWQLASDTDTSDTSSSVASAGPTPKVANTPERETVLIADGPEGIGRLTVELTPEGTRILSATDTETALDLIQTEPIDLVLIGTGITQTKPLELAQHLRAGGLTAPIVLVTGVLDAQTATASFAAGVTDHLIQPYTAAQARACVRRWLQRYRQHVNAAGPAAGVEAVSDDPGHAIEVQATLHA